MPPGRFLPVFVLVMVYIDLTESVKVYKFFTKKRKNALSLIQGKSIPDSGKAYYAIGGGHSR